MHQPTSSIIVTQKPYAESRTYPISVVGSMRDANHANYIIVLDEYDEAHEMLIFKFIKDRGLFAASQLCQEWAEEFPSMCYWAGSGFSLHGQDAMVFKLKYM